MSVLVMQPDDIESLAEKIAESMDRKRQISEEQHQRDHEWAKAKREREESLKGVRGRFLEKVFGTLGIAGILGLVYWLGSAILNTAQFYLGNGP